MNWSESKQVNELEAYVALLSVSGVGPATLAKLIRSFGCATDAVKRPLSALVEKAGISRPLGSTIIDRLDLEDARRQVEKIRSLNWQVALDTDQEYPASLLEISGRPPVLFYFGSLADTADRSIAIVGSRTASEEGRIFAAGIGAALAGAGVAVISGMAHGIDRAAHRGALSAGGPTVAVLGCSLDYRFSPTDRTLVKEIASHGAVVSEFPPGSPTLPEHFPRRNRIISGLSLGVVVVEAGKKSGALLTAQNALDQNRELFATPGFPGRRQSVGTNELIKQGAHPLTEVEDIFVHLPRLKYSVTTSRVRSFENLTPEEERILEFVTAEPCQLDILSRQLGISVSDTMPTLLALELRGVVKEISGKRFVLAR